MSRVGQQIGLPHHCERLLTRDDAAVLVFPEGQRGSGRVVWGSIQASEVWEWVHAPGLRTGTPIVPFGFVGGEEMSMSFSRMEPIARRIGLPYLPLSPTLLPLPLPAKCMLNIGAPLRFEGTGNESDDVVASYIDEVKTSIAAQIAVGRANRRHPYFG